MNIKHAKVNFSTQIIWFTILLCSGFHLKHEASKMLDIFNDFETIETNWHTIYILKDNNIKKTITSDYENEKYKNIGTIQFLASFSFNSEQAIFFFLGTVNNT